jgi:hypothetical protein
MLSELRLVVRRDGGDALGLTEESRKQTNSITTIRLAAVRQFEPITTFSVSISRTAIKEAPAAWRGVGSPHIDPYLTVSESVVGDHLDALSDQIAAHTPAVVLKVEPKKIRELRSRPRTTDNVALDYLTAKTWWARRHRQHAAVFSYPDQIRLGYPIADLRILADSYRDVRWSHWIEEHPDGFALVPTDWFMREAPSLLGGS